MNPIVYTIGLLTASNVLMTFAWYAHLKALNHRPWPVGQLKILQDSDHAHGVRALRLALSR